jgi:hypothetical protein
LAKSSSATNRGSSAITNGCTYCNPSKQGGYYSYILLLETSVLFQITFILLMP